MWYQAILIFKNGSVFYMNKAVIKKLYDDVFDSEGNIRACGRDACKCLIEAISSESSLNVGNADTGMMNIDVLKSEYDRIISLSKTDV